MDRHTELLCRDELRAARSAVLRDAEAFPELLFALERLGALKTSHFSSLAQYKAAILDIASRSPLASSHSAYGSSAERLFELVRKGRNEALHQGAYARHLATHAVELSLIVEDGLVNGAERIGDLMVRTPVRAEEWHRISQVRREMLLNSFSYLPIFADASWVAEEGWYLISDLAISRLLRSAGSKAEREKRLLYTVRQAVEGSLLTLVPPLLTGPDTSPSELLNDSNGEPVLVIDEAQQLIGIATPFDLL